MWLISGNTNQFLLHKLCREDFWLCLAPNYVDMKYDKPVKVSRLFDFKDLINFIRTAKYFLFSY